MVDSLLVVDITSLGVPEAAVVFLAAVDGDDVRLGVDDVIVVTVAVLTDTDSLCGIKGVVVDVERVETVDVDVENVD